MRKSNEEAAETRQRIVRTASRLFRQHGLRGIGVADLMRRAGLTHGGFYKHFRSKDALVAEACATGLAQTRKSLARAAESASPGEGLRRILETYLSRSHRDHPETGCTIAALGGEAARADAAGRQTLTAGVEDLIELVAAQLSEATPEARRARAAAIVSAMVGGLLVSRAVADQTLSDEVLRDTRSFILDSVNDISAR